jgi:hypothetical protein
MYVQKMPKVLKPLVIGLMIIGLVVLTITKLSRMIIPALAIINKV